MDPRHLPAGHPIPSEGYADQPYVVRTADGAWLCVMTTGSGHEGDAGQHLVARRSTDRGVTWGEPIDIEPARGPESSYGVLLATPKGRIYCFYNHNTDNVRSVKMENGKEAKRVDSLGYYVFKFSDDGGRTWSPQRYNVPVRPFACDLANTYQGTLRFFWNVGRPLLRSDGSVLLTLHKIGAFGQWFLAQSEGAFIRSDNLLTEDDPARLRFETLPEGDVGLKAPPGGGRIAEEQSVVELSDGSLYCVYRTVAGRPACARSINGGRTWSPPEYKTYTPGGRVFKHPRAANFVWRLSNGRYLYWFHNHGGARAVQQPGWDPYNDRNPAWLCAGREVVGPDGMLLAWSEPEIILYDDDPLIRFSYPDLIEEDGRIFITETQKSVGRVHAIEPALIEGLLDQHQSAKVSTEGLVLEAHDPAPGARLAHAALPVFITRDWSSKDYRGINTREGFTLDLWLKLADARPGRVLLDSRDAIGAGLLLTTADAGTLRVEISDGRQTSAWTSDPGLLQPGLLHHVAVVIDAGPRVITFVIDGRLCDGGEDRPFGWGRFSPTLQHANGSGELLVTPGGGPASGPVAHLRLYARALRTSEAVSHWRTGCPGACG